VPRHTGALAGLSRPLPALPLSRVAIAVLARELAHLAHLAKLGDQLAQRSHRPTLAAHRAANHLQELGDDLLQRAVLATLLTAVALLTAGLWGLLWGV
jgi:hypothetical protein